jgi:soluble lytic murein transglycosylase-like protein
MTKKTKLFAATPISRRPRRWVEKRKAMVGAAILGVALASLLASSAVRRAEAIADVTASVVETRSDLVATPAPSADRGRVDVATRHEREIDAVSAAVAKRYRVARDATRELVALAYQAGARSGVDPLLIIAVIAVESRFNPIAQSDGGAMGLMQVIPHYHADKLGAGSVLDPETNIQLGARVLKEYLRRGGTEVAGLQLYNGSSGDADNGYAQRVLAEKQRLREALRHERDRNHA